MGGEGGRERSMLIEERSAAGAIEDATAAGDGRLCDYSTQADSNATNYAEWCTWYRCGVDGLRAGCLSLHHTCTPPAKLGLYRTHGQRRFFRVSESISFFPSTKKRERREKGFAHLLRAQ